MESRNLKKILGRAVLLLGLLTACAAWAGPLVVVVNPESGVDALTREEVINVFLGRYKKLPTGVRAQPLDEASLKGDFYQRLVGKTLAEINAYWARLVFSGQTAPPRQITGMSAALDAVAAERGAIAYVDKTQVDRRVRIVLELE